MFGIDIVDLFSSLVFLDYISPFNIYYKFDLVIPNYPNFFLSEKLFISPSILNEILAGYSNFGCRFFPFSTLNIYCHPLLACRVSVERSAVKCMGFPLFVTCCFPLAAFKILSFCLLFVFLFFFWDLYNSNAGAFDTVPEVSEAILSYFHSFQGFKVAFFLPFDFCPPKFGPVVCGSFA